MIDAIVTVYTEIELLSTDNVLQRLLVDAWLYGGRELAKGVSGADFKRLMEVAPRFVEDVHTRLMREFEFDTPERTLTISCPAYGTTDDDTDSRFICSSKPVPNCFQCGNRLHVRAAVITSVKLSRLPTYKAWAGSCEQEPMMD